MVPSSSSSSSCASEWSNYKKKEKLIRACQSLEECVARGLVIDFTNTTHSHINNTNISATLGYSTSQVLMHGQSKTLVLFTKYSGVSVVLSALSSIQQYHTSKTCLKEWIQPPNTSNILEQPKDVWKTYIQQRQRKVNGGRHKCSKQYNIHDIRWVTLGYHYNWLHRCYTTTYNEFPPDLAQLCSDIITAINPFESLRCQAGIINIYPKGSSMGGHQDDAEHTYIHPVLSISLGCVGIFLLGGFTKDEEPIAFALYSGDVLILGGESRLRYHGMCRTFPGIVPDFITNRMNRRNQCVSLKEPHDDSDGNEEEEVLAFLEQNRININVRQVYANITTEWTIPS